VRGSPWSCAARDRATAAPEIEPAGLPPPICSWAQGAGKVAPMSRALASGVTRLALLSGLSGLAYGAGCADRGAPPPADLPPATPSSASAPADPKADPEPGAAPTSPATTPSPATPPTPAPAPTLPGGAPIVACAEPPARMACIEGGPFVRGADDGPSNARPAATVHLQTFYMDVHEVTYEEYGACMKEKKCPRARPRYLGFDHPKMPMTGVSWYDAQAYCEAHGKTLPTEAQWEKAARGPDGALYSWGDEPVTCERAIIQDESGRGCGLKKEKSKPETGRPWDIGSRPAGVYGLHDMIGNSWEWTADWYSRSWEACGADCEGVDPKGPCGGAETCPGTARKVLRGGSWFWPAEMATGTYRRAHVATNDPYHHFGFRCAATVEQAEALRGATATAP
jgi:sulfatase modifying factor 1